MWDKLKPYYIELLRLGWANGAAAVGIDAAFDLAREEVQDILGALAKRVKDIDATTEETIQRIIGQGAAEGWSRDRVRDELLARAVTESVTRAENIAHTETALAQETGAHLAYRTSGQVAGTEWLLGPEPCELCEPLGGKVAPLGEEFADGVLHPPYHPRCTCATAPVLKEA